MADNKTEIKPAKSAFSLIDPRDHFIGIAMGKLLDQQIQLKQLGQYDIVGNHAVRYADAVMTARSKAPETFVVVKGKKMSAGADQAVVPLSVLDGPPNDTGAESIPEKSEPTNDEPPHPKPIAERIGKQPELEEVK
jgi:hypothetical protein